MSWDQINMRIYMIQKNEIFGFKLGYNRPILPTTAVAHYETFFYSAYPHI